MIISETNAQWEAVVNALADLLKANITLPVHVSYAICKNRLRIEQALEAYRMTKDKLIEQYSGGKGTITREDDPEAFDRLLLAIASVAKEKTEADISFISLSELSLGGPYPLSVIDALTFMMTAEEE